MKIIFLAASNSKKSINQQFVKYVASQFDHDEKEILDLNDFSLPLYSVDVEQESGIPQNAITFYNKLQDADGIVISLAEHNGTYTAVFKNLFDWVSRHEVKMFKNKKLFLVSTSPGGRGGQGVMDAALIRFPIHGAEIIGHFSLPMFQQNFDDINGILDEPLRLKFEAVLSEVKSKL